MKRGLEICFITVAFIFALASCTPAGVECGLIGKWVPEDFDSKEFSVYEKYNLEFTSDDKMKVNYVYKNGSVSNSFEWEIDKSESGIINFKDKDETYAYTLSGGKLTLWSWGTFVRAD